MNTYLYIKIECSLMVCNLQCDLGTFYKRIVDTRMASVEAVGNRERDILIGVLANHIFYIAYLKLIAIGVEIACDDALYPRQGSMHL